MKTKYIFASIALASAIFTGCQDLDTLPDGSTITGSQKEEVVGNDPTKASAAVNAIYAPFKVYMPNETALGAARHNDFGYPSVMMFTDANGYDVVSEDNDYNWAGNSLDFADREFTSRESQIVWNDMYSIIFACNSVIGSISAETDNSTSQFYLAQGLTTRAFSYFILAQLYQFNYAGNESKPCVPIITNENSDQAALEGAPRSTVEEVYALIMNDMNLAVKLLQEAEAAAGDIREDKRYVNLAVAYGMRARINLTMQNWSAAASDATAAIAASTASPATITDVSVPAFMSVSEKNWMWGIIVEETDRIVTSGIVNWISHKGSLNYGYANFSGGHQINKKLYNSIAATDVRKGWFLNEDSKSPNINTAQQAWMDRYYGPYTHVKFAPYQNVVGNSTNANDMPLMRIEEMYLIKAEGEAMSGGNGKGTLESFVKTYRDPEYSCMASSSSEVQDEIFRQRRIELWGEGLNWYDIMRLNKPVDRRGGGYPNATMIFNIAAGSDILLWRIPEAEIQANPALTEADNNKAAPVPTPVADQE